MTHYRVTWEVDIDIDGDHLAAAQACARTFFKPEIANGEPGFATFFEVAGPKGAPALIDIAPSLSDLDGDDTE